MDGENQLPTFSPEGPAVSPPEGPILPSSAEQLPTAEKGAEAAPSPERARPSQGFVLPPVHPPALPADDTKAKAKDDDDSDDDTPRQADDVDVIEMEWVNKAKQIIEKNKDNPHAQEAAFEKLQRDYLKKRYGKEIKSG